MSIVCQFLPLIFLFNEHFSPLINVKYVLILPLKNDIYMYLRRKIDQELLDWSKELSRKPLLLRGARQVGKSSAVKELSKHFDNFLEINFEEQRQVHSLFSGDLSPIALCENLSVLYNTPIVPGKTLLFFDEIQSCIPAISSLRFFYEKYPELHVIAAGSLLEFALRELPSFGVGRVRSMFVYPFSFDEFLSACGEELLIKVKQGASATHPLNEAIHNKLLNYLKRFLVIGGMPEVVVKYTQGQKLLDCQKILDDLIISLKADFSKYKKLVPFSRISEVFESVAKQTGGKFVFKDAATVSNFKQIKESLDLLIMAGLVIHVTHSSANGIPIGAESNVKKRKMFIFDTGIFQRLMGLNISDILFEDRFDMVNKGSIAEQYVGLELLKSSSSYLQQDLFYWQREKLNSNAEVDYLVQKQNEIIPIEVKSGKQGSMQSLYLFLKEKKSPYGIRFSLENFSVYGNIMVYPLYAVSDFIQQTVIE
jgi:predicted AAA+ superfamily ATPase